MTWRTAESGAPRGVCGLRNPPCGQPAARHYLLSTLDPDEGGPQHLLLCAEHSNPLLGADADLQVRESHPVGLWCGRPDVYWRHAHPESFCLLPLPSRWVQLEQVVEVRAVAWSTAPHQQERSPW